MPVACNEPLTPTQRALVEQWRYLPRRLYRALSHRADVRLLGADDAVSAGVEGLIRAARRYDPTMGIKFVSYAWQSVARMIVFRAEQWARGSADVSLDSIGPGDAEPFQPAAPETEPADILLRERLDEALRSLPPRWRRVVQMRSAGRRLREVAETMGVSGERVRQVEQKALARLREKLSSHS